MHSRGLFSFIKWSLRERRNVGVCLGRKKTSSLIIGERRCGLCDMRKITCLLDSFGSLARYNRRFDNDLEKDCSTLNGIIHSFASLFRKQAHIDARSLLFSFSTKIVVLECAFECVCIHCFILPACCLSLLFSSRFDVDVRSCIEQLAIRSDVITCVTTKRVCACTTQTRAAFVLRTDSIARSLMAYTINGRRFTTSKSWRRSRQLRAPWKLQTAGQTSSIRSAT